MTKEYRHSEYRKRKHKRNRENIIIPLLTTSIVLVILIFTLDQINFGIRTAFGASALIFTSFASSAFIIFMMPYSKAAKTSRFVKSYVIAGIIGYIGFSASAYINFYLIAGLIIFFVSLLLFETDSEHPPALGIAMAFLLYRVPLTGILILFAGIAIMVLFRKLLKKIGVLITEIKVR
ncbi:HPP family protein [Candidatus Parvarchaeota archaeon]|nr:HPP family protein [Candidatus Parvarchaeota archaeon]